MAGITINFFVRTIKCKFCLFVVIKFPDLPAIRVVALFANRAEAQFVNIIFTMAVIAFFAGALVMFGGMAIITGGDGMQAYKRKFTQIMIKYNI